MWRNIIILISQVRELKLREVKYLSQGHTAGKYVVKPGKFRSVKCNVQYYNGSSHSCILFIFLLYGLVLVEKRNLHVSHLFY